MTFTRPLRFSPERCWLLRLPPACSFHNGDDGESPHQTGFVSLAMFRTSFLFVASDLRRFPVQWAP
jgi:hypothetical protein